MKPTTLTLTTLIAGALAGVAPEISTPIKSAFAPGSAAAHGSAGVSMVQLGWPRSSQAVVMHSDGGSYAGFLPLQNKSQQDACFTLRAYAEAPGGAPILFDMEPGGSFKLIAFEAAMQRVRLSLRSGSKTLPATGFVRITSGPADPKGSGASCAITGGGGHNIVDQEVRFPEGPIMGAVFAMPTMVTSVIVIVTAINLLRKRIGLLRLMGQANFSFERSWGANVTLGGALLMTLIGLTTFPDRTQLMSKPSYSMLQMLFAALLAISPLVYNLIRRDVAVNNGGIDTRGYVVTFLFAGGLVLWAAMGQVVTLAVLVEEFIRAGTLDVVTGRIMQLLAGLVGVLLIVYGFRSLYRTAKGVSAAPTTVGGIHPGPQSLSAMEIRALPAPMTEWSIL